MAKTRDFAFTVNAGHRGDLSWSGVENKLRELMGGPQVVYGVFQREIGEGGTEHIQGYIYFKNARTGSGVLKTLQKLGFQAHIGARYSSPSAAAAYCKKDDTRKPGTTFSEFGTLPMDNGKKRTFQEAVDLCVSEGPEAVAEKAPEQYVRYHRGLQALAQTLKAKKLKPDRQVKVYVLWGDSGTGKTYAGMHWGAPEDVHKVQEGQDGKVWADGYAGQKILVLDEFRFQGSEQFLYNLADSYKLNLPVKGGHVWAEFETLIITSNFDPKTWWDAGKNPWYFDGVRQGPLQRRITKLYKASGSRELGTDMWEEADPIDCIYRVSEGPPGAAQAPVETQPTQVIEEAEGVAGDGLTDMSPMPEGWARQNMLYMGERGDEAMATPLTPGSVDELDKFLLEDFEVVD